MSATYTLNFNNISLFHGRDRSQHLSDGDIYSRRRKLQTQIESGDLFITMATKLDDLSKYLKKSDEAASQEFQAVITDLLYLQAYYSVVKNDSHRF